MNTLPRNGFRNSGWWLHLAAVIGITGSLAAGWFEYTRAIGGNQLSWAYTVEWPMIAGYGCYLWWRLARERRDGAPAPRRSRDRGPVIAADDPQLLAWQAYQAEVRNGEAHAAGSAPGQGVDQGQGSTAPV